MKTYTLAFISLISICSFACGLEKEYLDNFELSKLGNELHDPEVERVNIIGKKVRVTVQAHKREDGTVYGQLLTERENQLGWATHLINFYPYIFDKIEDGENYIITGVIVENRMDYGAFWIYVNECEKADQDGVVNSESLRSSP